MEQTNFSMLINKKTKVDDKIKFLETFSINSNIETKINLISYLIVLASDRNQKLQEVSSKLLNTFITSLDCNFNLTIFKELLKGVSNEQNDRTKLFTLELINRLTERDNFRNSLPSMVEVLSYLLYFLQRLIIKI